MYNEWFCACVIASVCVCAQTSVCTIHTNYSGLFLFNFQHALCYVACARTSRMCIWRRGRPPCVCMYILCVTSLCVCVYCVYTFVYSAVSAHGCWLQGLCAIRNQHVRIRSTHTHTNTHLNYNLCSLVRVSVCVCVCVSSGL